MNEHGKQDNEYILTKEQSNLRKDCKCLLPFLRLPAWGTSVLSIVSKCYFVIFEIVDLAPETTAIPKGILRLSYVPV